MKNTLIICTGLLIVLTSMFYPHTSLSQEKFTRKTYNAVNINLNAPEIDGKLDDPIWQGGAWATGFRQIQPNDGDSPTQKTEFKIVYDENNLYVAFRLHDDEPEKIERRVTRRDGFDGDWIEIEIDSYYDQRTAFSFTLTAAGVKGDEFISDDGGNWDTSWEPVWYGKVGEIENGWTAEYKIPFNQLRFSDSENQIWGFNVTRRYFREDERVVWQYKTQDTPGYVSHMAELRGIKNVKQSNNIEFLPYMFSKFETTLSEAGNPFNDGRNGSALGGLDAKIGVTSDLTLNLTINPDFGQVEADPSVVNLSAFETFFQEKRPFFVEGRNILNYNLTGGDGDMSSNNLFYSRRIGRSPQHYIRSGTNKYIESPLNTNIATAAKLTGKTKNGYSIGLLNAITVKEYAKVLDNGTREDIAVEPLTNYLIGRLQKDFRRGDTRIGGMLTSTNRKIDDDQLNFLNNSAYTGGFDIVHNWKEKTYYATFKTIFSKINGSTTAIENAQLSSRRYFQRPDAEHLDFNDKLTSMSGHGGNVDFGKGGNGHIRFNLNTNWVSPGLDLNDVGFLNESDVIMQSVWVQYREWKPQWIFRNYSVNINQWSGWNFGQVNMFNGGNININGQFKNYWSAGGGLNRNFSSLSKSRLRGGPMFKTSARWNLWYNLNSDQRKSVIFGFNGNYSKSDDNSSVNYGFRPRVTWRPSNQLRLTFNPFYSKNVNNTQYLERIDLADKSEYILANINQKTAGLVLRADYSLTPTMSIQYYGQPFISAGKYNNFKRVTNSKADNYENRFHQFSDSEISYNSTNSVYDVSDASGNYSIKNTDFNFLQFKSNLVVRWEYSPGSTFFLVWTQNRTGYNDNGVFSFENDFDNLFSEHPDNVFLVKFNRWLSK